MAKKPKRKLTAEQRRAKKHHKRETMIVFINGKQKRVTRPPKIDGLGVDEFIRENADPIWLMQNEMWELMGESESQQDAPSTGRSECDRDGEVPF